MCFRKSYQRAGVIRVQLQRFFKLSPTFFKVIPGTFVEQLLPKEKMLIGLDARIAIRLRCFVLG